VRQFFDLHLRGVKSEIASTPVTPEPRKERRK
jgi:hypothetical protein